MRSCISSRALVRNTVMMSALLLPALHAASLTQFDQVLVFGDSLSDTGNLSIATGGQFPGSNYAPGRFTDGPNTTPATNGPVGLWVEQLATKLGMPDPQPFLAGNGGTDFAVASATTGSNGLYDISDQLQYAGTKIDSNALVTIWGGANDLFNGVNSGAKAATNLYGDIRRLAAAGAKTVLWLNLPPLDQTPLGVQSGNAATLMAETQSFNKTWKGDLLLLQAAGINVIGVDIYSLFGQIAASPAAFGFANITTPAQGQASVDPNTYLFWDMEHPTTAGHQAVENAALNALATPEPASVAVMALGLVLLLLVRRVRKVRFGVQ